MISRRVFFGALAGAVEVAKVAPQESPIFVPSAEFLQSSALRVMDTGGRYKPLTFKGVPIVFDADVPHNQLALLDPKNGPMLVTDIGDTDMK